MGLKKNNVEKNRRNCNACFFGFSPSNSLPVFQFPAVQETGNAVRSDTSMRPKRCRPATAGNALRCASRAPGSPHADPRQSGSGRSDGTGTSRSAAGTDKVHPASKSDAVRNTASKTDNILPADIQNSTRRRCSLLFRFRRSSGTPDLRP